MMGSAESCRQNAVQAATNDLVFRGNRIADTRPGDKQTQTTGILVEEHVGSLVLEGNSIEAKTQIDDRRSGKANTGKSD